MKAHLARLGAGDYAALIAYIQRTPEHIALLQELRTKIRDAKKVATVAEFGPRFLHSTGQAYKGGPNSGVFTSRSRRRTRPTWRCPASATRSAWSRRPRRAATSTCWPNGAAGPCACTSPVTWRRG